MIVKMSKREGELEGVEGCERGSRGRVREWEI